MGDQVYNPGGDHGAFCVQYMENLVGTPGLNRYIGDYHVGLPHLSYFRNDYCRTQDD